MEVPRVLAFQHGEVGHDLKPDSQDLLIPAQRIRSDGDLFTLLYEGNVYDGGHAVRLYSAFAGCVNFHRHRFPKGDSPCYLPRP